MILAKLQEALAAVDIQRGELDQVEKELRSMIARLSGVPDITPVKMPRFPTAPSPPTPSAERDGIDDIVDVLHAEGKPLHITIIAERLSARKGTTILRTAIEPGLNRHVTKTKSRRLEKFGPSTFGLPEWNPASFARSA